MGSVQEYKDRRKNPWRAQVRSKRHGTKVTWWPDPDAAWEWVHQREAEWLRIKERLPPTDDNLAKTVETLIETYRKKKTHKKASAPTEHKVFDRFLAFKDYRTRQLRDFKNADCWHYAEYLEDECEWSGRTLKPSTVIRTISVLRTTWAIAARWPGYEGLVNPWLHPIKVKPEGVSKKRRRRLRKGELGRIIESCEGCREHWALYAPFAIYMAIDTALRLQEVFQLRWEDIDFHKRRLRVYKSKTDYKKKTNGRTIVLPLMSWAYLQLHLYTTTGSSDYEIPTEGNIFPNSKGNYKESWRRIRLRAGIPNAYRDYTIPGTDTLVKSDGEGLTIHDLRREAASRMKRALSLHEVSVMTGHMDLDVEFNKNTETYIEYDEDDLTEIQNKLDRYALGGETQAEAIAQGKVIVLELVDGDMKVSAMFPNAYDEQTKPTTKVVPFKRKAHGESTVKANKVGRKYPQSMGDDEAI